MQYITPAKCPICGHAQNATIEVFGDYDGGDAIELKNCASCKGIKMAAPALFVRMVEMRNEFLALEESIESRIGQAIAGMIDPRCMERLLHSPFEMKGFFRKYQKEFIELMKCLEEGEKPNRWVHENAAKKMIWDFVKKSKVPMPKQNKKKQTHKTTS